VLMKQRRLPFPQQSSFRVKERLELVHGDLCRPVTLATPGGRCYFLLLIDDLSRYMWVVVLGSKGEATEAECGRKLRALRTDNGSEFTTAEFTSYCVDEGVQRYYSAPYSPQQNDIVERQNQTVVGMAQAASHSARSLATSASSTTGALQGCLSATRRARRPTAFLTQGHNVCA
jgi:transposase InsO family protein